mgnify:CR=1 FL=1
MINHYLSPLGWIEYRLDKGYLTSMRFVDNDNYHATEDQVSEQLRMYFEGTRHHFDLDIKFENETEFQRSIWVELLKIPYGKTVSYQDLGKRISNPKAVRAIGQACKRNPIGIIVPCHRVIGKNQLLTGYSGKDYIHLKAALLAHEKSHT